MLWRFSERLKKNDVKMIEKLIYFRRMRIRERIFRSVFAMVNTWWTEKSMNDVTGTLARRSYVKATEFGLPNPRSLAWTEYCLNRLCFATTLACSCVDGCRSCANTWHDGRHRGPIGYVISIAN